VRLAAGSLLILAACSGSTRAGYEAAPDGGVAAAQPQLGPNVDTSDPPGPPPGDKQPCPKSPCTQRPVIFIHGHTGSIHDAQPILDAYTAPGERFDGVKPVGTADHQTWAPKSIPRRSWLFAFDYYSKNATTDPQGSWTAGPGRIGTDGTFACSAGGKGHVRPTEEKYDNGITHEYANDFAAAIDDILAATGESQVDIITHSMGGLVARSTITFFGADKVNTVLFLATPHLGVSFASGEGTLVNPGDQPWMTDHELAELDRTTLLTSTKFNVCGQPDTDTWPNLLLNLEKQLPKLPTYHCMRGANDPIVDDASANHPACVDFQEVPDADHGGVARSPEATSEALRVIGGFVTASTKL
jgi:pimeloyl-ACP methyl ester carboxylesterase